MIKWILFDLDDTLFDFKKAERIALSSTLSAMGLEPKDEILARYSQINQEQWQLLEQKKITKAQVVISRFQRLFQETGIDAQPQEAQSLYEVRLATGHYFMPGAEEVIKQLYGQYELYIVTNGTAKVQDSRIKSAGIAPYFEKIFISERIGHNKPSLEFFEHCFQEIPNIVREETVIIGDSLTSDMRGGVNANIHTLWYNPKHIENSLEVRPEKEVAQLLDIPAVIKQW